MGKRAARPERIHHYRTPIYDSDRWQDFDQRPGDVLVCTAPKCGTTWTQMICALLVHQSPDLPQPLTRLSRWVERLTQPIEVVNDEMAAQPFRRVLKSHTPFDGLPYAEDVSYVVCGRDPRDAFLSMLDHFDNLSPESLADAAVRMGLPADSALPFPTEPDALFAIWQTVPDQVWTEDGVPFGSMTHFIKSYWAWRRLPNLYFLHYADLMSDLEGEMRRLADFLGVSVSEETWPALVGAASFTSMREDADSLAPGAHLGEWKSNDAFFKRARMGEWRTRLSPESQALYERLSTARLEPPLKRWLEGGRAAGGDPRTS